MRSARSGARPSQPRARSPGAANATRPVADAAGRDSDCASCHSGSGRAPPFRDQTGSTDPIRLTVGAHDPHLHADLAAPLSCGDCHDVP